jgi:hypothetical protein
MSEPPPHVSFVVEIEFDCEGRNALAALATLEDAIVFANENIGGDTMVITLMNPRPSRSWYRNVSALRNTPDVTYRHEWRGEWTERTP